MARYQRQEVLDERSYSEQMLAEQAAQQEQVQEAGMSDEEKTFKQRYGEIRQFMAAKEKQHQDALAKMQEQLEAATRKQIRFPKTDEEINEWSEKYPEVSKIIDTIAQKRASEAMESLREGEKRLKSLETKLSKKDAEATLQRLHPDFGKIRQDPKFHDWVATQPQNIQDSLYKNTTDAMAAARSLDLYKSDMGIRTAKKNASRTAAQAVTRTTNSAPPTRGGTTFSESQIAAMSDAEFEKHKEAIQEQQRRGEIVYDLSGAAR